MFSNQIHEADKAKQQEMARKQEPAKIMRFTTSSKVSKMGDSFYFRIPKERTDIHALVGKEVVLIVKILDEVAGA
jgi:hypothetical protein